MKFRSLVATLSCTGIMAVSSLAVNAETTSNIAINDLDSSASKPTLKATQDSSPADFKRQNSQNRARTIPYSIFSLVKDQQITLNNAHQQPELKDREWYIEKF